MNVFVVIHSSPRAEELTARVEDSFGRDCFVISPTVLFLRTQGDDPVVIKEVAGIGPADEADNKVSGLVVKLNATHSGFFRKDFWEWFREARERTE